MLTLFWGRVPFAVFSVCALFLCQDLLSLGMLRDCYPDDLPGRKVLGLCPKLEMSRFRNRPRQEKRVQEAQHRISSDFLFLGQFHPPPQKKKREGEEREMKEKGDQNQRERERERQ